MYKELTSIILLSYKNLEYIEETIDSILIQSYKNIELIIGDDGSKEFNNQKYIDYIAKKNNGNIKNVIVYSNTKNLGIVKNANKAIGLANGKYIKFIGADDSFYSNNVIDDMYNYMIKNNSLILTTNILRCDREMNKLDISEESIEYSRKKLLLGNNPNVFFKELSKGCFIPAPGVMLNKDIFKQYGMFDEDYALIEDWPTWLKLSRQGAKFDYLDIISVKYRTGVGVSALEQPNPIFMRDQIKCIEKEILPYKRELGYYLHKNINYRFARLYKFNEYSLKDKVLFILANIDILFINQIKRILIKLKRNDKNENQ